MTSWWESRCHILQFVFVSSPVYLLVLPSTAPCHPLEPQVVASPSHPSPLALFLLSLQTMVAQPDISRDGFASSGKTRSVDVPHSSPSTGSSTLLSCSVDSLDHTMLSSQAISGQ